MTPSAEQILRCLQAVADERDARMSDSGLAGSTDAIKRYQHARFGLTYADLLAHPRFSAAARFFLTDLYGPADFSERDAQFARIVPALVRLFPAHIVDTVAELAELHALSERLDTAMARQRIASGGAGRAVTGADYGAWWRAVGDAAARERQIVLMVSVGQALDRYTRNRLLRQSLRLMRGPAAAAGLGALQGFLERGFDTFRDMSGAEVFLSTIASRERALAERLFAGGDAPRAFLVQARVRAAMGSGHHAGPSNWSRPALHKPWLSQYPEGVPPEADVGAYRNLAEVLEAAFRRHPKRDALCCMDSRLTFGELDELSASFGAWLQTLGLERGDRVALMMPNVPQYLVALSGVLRAGYVVVNVNPLYTARELQHQLQDSGAKAIVVLENFAATLEEVIDQVPVQHVVLASLGEMLGFWRGRLINFAVRHVRRMVPEFSLPIDGGRTVTRFGEAVDRGSRLSLRRVDISPDDVAFLQYTGGTTGVSKGATLLHRNVVANLMQCEAWFKPMLNKVSDQQLTIVCALPLYHIFALTICALMGAHFGAMNLLIPNPRDFPGFIRTLAKHRVNMFPGVNTLFNALVNDPDFARLDFSGLVVSNGGGMAVQKATADRWLRITGCPVVEGYGLSETSPVATSNRLDLQEFSGTIGLPVPSTEIAIRDDAGQDVPIGDPGEICIRGPQVMAGYWNRPDETAKVMTADGFFKSGDVGIMDERGYVRIVDRKKDMILVSGFNVYPNEIEQVVSQHPGVLECAAIGIPDDKSGEAVKLYVVRNDGTLSEDDLARYCRDNFTAYKRPKYIEFRDELPKSNVGKILRRELRQGSA